MNERLAYTISDAAVAVGVSERVIRRALASGDLTAKYVTSRPVILADELRAWVEAAPSVYAKQKVS